MESVRLFVLCTFRLVSVLILAAVLMLSLGKTPLWSQSSGSNLNDSQSTLQTWSELYNQGQQILQKQNAISENLKQEILTLRTGYGELMNLSEELSLSNENLKRYNEQIAERMQERDEDLAAAYQELDEQDKELLKKDNLILKLVIAVSVLGLLIIGAIVFAVIKGYIKMKMPIKLQ